MIGVPEHDAAVRRHTTRCRNELEKIIREAQLLHKALEKGQYRDAQSLITAAVTVHERMAILETLSDVTEWQAAGLVDPEVRHHFRPSGLLGPERCDVAGCMAGPKAAVHIIGGK